MVQLTRKISARMRFSAFPLPARTPPPPRPDRSALSLSRRTERARASGADDEHSQRRRALRCAHRFSGVHDHAERRAQFSGSASLWRRNFSFAQESLTRRGLSTAVGDEGGFAPALSSADDALESICEPQSSGPVTNSVSKFSSRSMPPHRSSTTRKQNLYVFKKSDGSKRTADELVEYYAELCAEISHHLDRRWLRGK